VAGPSEAPDPTTMDADEFARLIAAWEDDGIIMEGLRVAGVGAVLDQVFTQMVERFRADAADGTEAEVQWLIEGRDEEHPYILRVADGEARWERHRAEEPDVTFRTDVPSFVRLVTGNADPARLVLTRRLRPWGNLLLAAKVPTFFEMPGGS
jgi:putative sterol carrier protein